MQELIDKFPNGQELFETSAAFNKIIHCVYRGMSLYEAVSFFAQKDLEQQEFIKNLIDISPHQPIIKTEDSFISKIKKCKHESIEEIQGGQIERCRNCGKTW